MERPTSNRSYIVVCRITGKLTRVAATPTPKMKNSIYKRRPKNAKAKGIEVQTEQSK